MPLAQIDVNKIEFEKKNPLKYGFNFWQGIDWSNDALHPLKIISVILRCWWRALQYIIFSKKSRNVALFWQSCDTFWIAWCFTFTHWQDLFFSHFEMSPYVDVQFPIQTYKAAMVLQCHVKAVFFKILTKGIWISTYLFLHARKFCESWENIVITIKLLLVINQF